MADKGIVARAKVEALVESIRAKSGVTGPLSFDAMKTAVDGIQTGGGSGGVLDSVAYYKAHRNKDYPYFPLPSEMTEAEDTIYMLYGAKGYMCCPVFNVTFTNCVCTVYKYNNTTLVSSYVETLTSNTTKYMQFSEEDEDYSTYNYIVIKLQGTITAHYLNYISKFNGVNYNNSSSSELIEVSGKCASCDVKVVNASYKNYQKLEYYSFLGVNTTDMINMFSNCYSLQTIPELDTNSVTIMGSMFYKCYSLQAIPQLNTSQVTYMSSMFYYCTSLQTIPELNTSKVINMDSMFYNCSSLQIIPELDTSSATGMNNMFYKCYALQAIPQLNTSKVTNMNSMFYYCSSLQTIPELNTSKVTNMDSMFYNCYFLQTIPELDTSSVTSMNSMFYNCSSLQTIPELDTSSVTSMNTMFSNCSSLQTIPELDTSSVASMNTMFSNCSSLQTISELDTSSVTSMNTMFSNCYILVVLDIINMKVSFSLTNSSMLSHDKLLKVLNNLATVATTQTLTLGSTNLAKLSDDEKAIATNKGWTLA